MDVEGFHGFAHHASEPLVHRGVPLEEAAGAVILVHGRGDSAEGILGLRQLLPETGLAFFAPQAKGGTWYPQSFLAPIEENEPGISSGVHVLKELVDRIKDSNLGARNILIAGFSQGACLASEFVARHPDRYGGLAVFSGGLIGNGERADADPPEDKTFDYSGDLEGTPVFLGCSDIDPHIPLARFERTAEVFRELGASVTKKVYPGMGHTINEDELAELRLLVGLIG